MLQPIISWYGHSAFKVTGRDKVVYFDPWKLPPNAVPADVLCVSHEHFDHCSVDDCASITRTETEIVTPRLCADKFMVGHVNLVKPGDQVTVGGIPVEIVPAYNTNKDFHPQADQRVGFIVTIDGVRIYHAGDTDLIPEMKDIRCDIALLPVSGTYVMTAEEAAQAAALIKPRIAIPMHYGSIIGTADDAKKFSSLVPPAIEVRVLKQVTK